MTSCMLQLNVSPKQIPYDDLWLLRLPLQACAVMYDVLTGSDDYTRKLQLVRWHQRLQAVCCRPQHHGLQLPAA